MPHFGSRCQCQCQSCSRAIDAERGTIYHTSNTILLANLDPLPGLIYNFNINNMVRRHVFRGLGSQASQPRSSRRGVPRNHAMMMLVDGLGTEITRSMRNVALPVLCIIYHLVSYELPSPSSDNLDKGTAATNSSIQGREQPSQRVTTERAQSVSLRNLHVNLMARLYYCASYECIILSYLASSPNQRWRVRVTVDKIV